MSSSGGRAPDYDAAPGTGYQPLELWAPMGTVRPEGIAARSRRVEADGWDGITVYDTQCLCGEAIAMMTAAAMATTGLQLSISTSNPATRHPSVAASAMATIAAMAGDRVWFGVGRGDSALAYTGAAPARVSMFEHYVAAVRRYLHGEPVSFESLKEWRNTESVSTLSLGHAPADSRIVWLNPEGKPPPIEVYATGPRVLAVAGRQADRVCLGLGADVRRVQWAIEVAREARAEAGLDPSTLRIGVLAAVGVSENLARARRSVANITASSARFAVIDGPVAGPVAERHAAVYRGIAQSYDMSQHGGLGSQVDHLTDEFIDDFSIVGSPQRCIERVLELRELGVTSIMLAPPQNDADAADIEEGYRRIAEDVVPGVRSATAPSRGSGS